MDPGYNFEAVLYDCGCLVCKIAPTAHHAMVSSKDTFQKSMDEALLLPPEHLFSCFIEKKGISQKTHIRRSLSSEFSDNFSSSFAVLQE